MIWGSISHNARADLHFSDSGSVNALMSIEDILLNYAVHCMSFVSAYLFMQDNAHPRMAQ